MQKYSLVTTVYNDEREIISLIKNIEQQVLLPEEFIIVDGGSTDATIEKIKECRMESNIKIRLFCGERLNIAQGFNKGIREAISDYIGIVACGNHYSTDFFSLLMEEIDKKDVYIAYSSVAASTNNEYERVYSKIYMGKENKLKYEFPHNHGNLAKKKMYEEYGFFNENFSYAGEDDHYFIKAINSGLSICYVEEAVVIWDVPNDLQSLKKQLKVYCIGDMEKFKNLSFFKIHMKQIIYSFSYFFILFIFLPDSFMRIIGMLFLVILLIFDIQLILRKGWFYFKVKNLTYFYPVYVMLCNLRLLRRKNKISDVISR